MPENILGATKVVPKGKTKRRKTKGLGNCSNESSLYNCHQAFEVESRCLLHSCTRIFWAQGLSKCRIACVTHDGKARRYDPASPCVQPLLQSEDKLTQSFTAQYTNFTLKLSNSAKRLTASWAAQYRASVYMHG